MMIAQFGKQNLTVLFLAFHADPWQLEHYQEKVSTMTKCIQLARLFVEVVVPQPDRVLKESLRSSATSDLIH